MVGEDNDLTGNADLVQITATRRKSEDQESSDARECSMGNQRSRSEWLEMCLWARIGIYSHGSTKASLSHSVLEAGQSFIGACPIYSWWSVRLPTVSEPQ